MSEDHHVPPPEPEVEKGLPMAPKWNPEQLAREKAELTALAARPLPSRALGYIKRSGPGIMQSAMTLGAGSAAASVVAGSLLGYKLLWVQPLGMFLGVMMLGALGNVVLSTRERPYKAFAKQIGFPLIFLWGFGSIIASVIWHFPQYALASGAVRDLIGMTGAQLTAAEGTTGVLKTNFTAIGFGISVLIGLAILAVNVTVVFSYGSGGKGIKAYEWFARMVIALVVVMFAVVCGVSTLQGKVDWLEIGKGFIGWYGIPKTGDPEVDAKIVTQVLGMIGAAVGINMTFLYPYSLLAKGWGKEHKSLARWDLGLTMLLPFTLVTSLIIIACTVGVHENPELKYNLLAEGNMGSKAYNIQPIQAADALTNVIGEGPGRIVFCLGLLGMTLTAIGAHMVVCGFTLTEMSGLKPTKKLFRLFAMTPCIGILGVVYPSPMWFPIFASAICFTMLPIAYLIFLIMNNRGATSAKLWAKVRSAAWSTHFWSSRWPWPASEPISKSGKTSTFPSRNGSVPPEKRRKNRLPSRSANRAGNDNGRRFPNAGRSTLRYQFVNRARRNVSSFCTRALIRGSSSRLAFSMRFRTSSIS